MYSPPLEADENWAIGMLLLFSTAHTNALHNSLLVRMGVLVGLGIGALPYVDI